MNILPVRPPERILSVRLDRWHGLFKREKIMLRRLAWSSVLSPTFSAIRVNEIVALSRWNNERDHISGMLLFTGASFLGILEGDEKDLDRLWSRLERDARHRDLLRIGHQLCGARWFPVWAMAHSDDAIVRRQIEGLRSPRLWSGSNWAEVMRPIMVRARSM